ncbi:hypothetical protein [Streptomyces sp. NPDC058374]|uniref:hypothetical protein n=1 Tax=unclassified Streptomyces TaxID=2593676 RepID=UPI0036692795
MNTSPATRPVLTYGGLSAGIGPLSLLAVALGLAGVPVVLVAGLIGGAVAAGYGAVGLAKDEGKARGRCLVGLLTGAAAFLLPTVGLVVVLAGT